MSILAVHVFEGHDVRFSEGKPVANDVAKALGYADPAKTVSTKVSAKNKGVTKLVTPGGTQSVTVLEEAGIYQLIFGSKLESAEKFQDWVFSEVLPSIRKTGSYGTQHYNLVWFDRLKLYRAKSKIPTGWFTIFEEMTIGLLADFEDAGYSLPDGSIPDISVGKCFCNHLRALGYSTEHGAGYVLGYKHWYPWNDFPVKANIYNIQLMGLYRQWFTDTYRTKYLPKYLKSKDPKALPSLRKMLGLPEGCD